MKLTKHHKEAFVRAVMNDLPTADFLEQASKLIQGSVYSQMPSEVKAVYDNKLSRHWLTLNNYHLSYVGTLAYYGGGFGNSSSGYDETARQELMKSIKLIESAASDAQVVKRNIEEKLIAVIASCTTLKVAESRLPEFVKYLPTDTDGVSTAGVPMIVDLVTTLTEAGWPKEENKELLAA